MLYAGDRRLLEPLGAADDPSLESMVGDYGTTLGWDEMREEMALPAPDGVTTSSAAVVDALTIDEQRELQRLLADEMAQPREAGARDNRDPFK